VTLLINRELASKAKLCPVSVFPDIVKDCPKIRNLPKIFLRSFENVAPDDPTNSFLRRQFQSTKSSTKWIQNNWSMKQKPIRETSPR